VRTTLTKQGDYAGKEEERESGGGRKGASNMERIVKKKIGKLRRWKGQRGASLLTGTAGRPSLTRNYDRYVAEGGKKTNKT